MPTKELTRLLVYELGSRTAIVRKDILNSKRWTVTLLSPTYSTIQDGLAQFECIQRAIAYCQTGEVKP